GTNRCWRVRTRWSSRPRAGSRVAAAPHARRWCAGSLAQRPDGGLSSPAAMEDARGLAAGCMVETAEGPVPIAETPGKGFPVLTRLPSGRLGFRQLIKVNAAGPVPLVRVILTTGHAVLAARGQDRKSTRLNSSHVSSSYAVFCLKKKRIPPA